MKVKDIFEESFGADATNNAYKNFNTEIGKAIENFQTSMSDREKAVAEREQAVAEKEKNLGAAEKSLDLKDKDLAKKTQTLEKESEAFRKKQEEERIRTEIQQGINAGIKERAKPVPPGTTYNIQK